MKLRVKEFDIYLDESVLIIGILSIIFKVVRKYFENFFICYLFIVFHEFSHMCVASIFGVATKNLHIRISGLNICLKEQNTNNLRWIIIYLAGPISNIGLAATFKNVPLVYTINLALAVINLIPIYPLDGYNIFEILLNQLNLKRKNIEKVQKSVEIMVIILLLAVGIYQFVFFENISIILMVIYIIIQSSNLRNNSASRIYQKCYKNITNFQENY